MAAPDSTAVRTALWRALHLAVDPPPHVFADELGLRLAGPGEGWRDRDDMDPATAGRYRAGMVARARFVEDLVTEQAARGVGQYVILGAGLDTFAQRRPDLASRLRVFEVDQPGPQAWKRARLEELGLGVPDWLRLVPVDFETASWWDRLAAAGFAPDEPAVVASTGVSMYLTKEANAATLRRIAGFAPGSTLAMTFLLPAGLLDDAERDRHRATASRAKAAGTPFVSSFSPAEVLAMARDAGFRDAVHVSGAELDERYFADRADGLRIVRGEEFLVATTGATAGAADPGRPAASP
ncbi:class I SAM-dependent methyltransferase [Amycolatopsis sp. A133]|uniref:class I SAM-dependent methyltransferase n=1 Tax=Amycolatopsis sp. A133 TaxID=3064472 RepID=UPI0027F7AE98|nr:class I SAM-dependent methyltransferase [Amycolatopsis sp. A133]MDQ7805368.1 class I SAM-dependent methyltransferase [Amycolatopsis sp. A133]